MRTRVTLIAHSTSASLSYLCNNKSTATDLSVALVSHVRFSFLNTISGRKNLRPEKRFHTFFSSFTSHSHSCHLFSHINAFLQAGLVSLTEDIELFLTCLCSNHHQQWCEPPTLSSTLVLVFCSAPWLHHSDFFSLLNPEPFVKCNNVVCVCFTMHLSTWMLFSEQEGMLRVSTVSCSASGSFRHGLQLPSVFSGFANYQEMADTCVSFIQ